MPIIYKSPVAGWQTSQVQKYADRRSSAAVARLESAAPAHRRRVPLQEHINARTPHGGEGGQCVKGNFAPYKNQRIPIIFISRQLDDLQ